MAAIYLIPTIAASCKQSLRFAIPPPETRLFTLYWNLLVGAFGWSARFARSQGWTTLLTAIAIAIFATRTSSVGIGIDTTGVPPQFLHFSRSRADLRRASSLDLPGGDWSTSLRILRSMSARTEYA